MVDFAYTLATWKEFCLATLLYPVLMVRVSYFYYEGRSTGVESLPERRGNGLENPGSGGVSSPSAEISRDSLDFEILN